MTISVLIADDQAMVRAGFAALLDAHEGIRVAGQAANGAEAVALAARLDPDVILMDVRMPEVDGIEATRRILGPGYPAAHVPRILMLTTFDIDDYVYDALEAGASGFLLKDALPEELVHAVRVVAGGDALLAPSVTRRMIEQFAGRRPRRDEGIHGQNRPASIFSASFCSRWPSSRSGWSTRSGWHCFSWSWPVRRTWSPGCSA